MGVLKELLVQEEYIILDGALGTELETRGFDVSGKLWSAKYLLENPQVIEELHEIYLRAGADIITTSSYQASIEGFQEEANLSYQEAFDVIASTVSLAKQARDKVWSLLSDSEKSKRPYPLIAGDIGPYAAYLSDGSEYTGKYDLSVEEFQDFHRPRIRALLSAGVDLLAVETMPNVTEVRAIIDLLSREFPEVEAYLSFTAQDDQHISDGTAVETVARFCQECPQILSLGINCSSPNVFDGLLKRIRTVSDKPLIAYPNSGEVYDGASQTWTSTPESSHTLLENALRWHQMGVKIIGGCCRTSPQDIDYLSRFIRK